MNYQTYIPPPSLSAYVKCFWTLEADSSFALQKQRIIPDGCMEMIFHHGDQYLQYRDDGSSVLQPRCFVFGQITSPLQIAPTAASGIFAVRFEPDGFSPFATLTPGQMSNRAVPLSELFGDEGLSLGEGVINAQSTIERISLIEIFLTAKLQLIKTREKLSGSTVELLLQTKGQLSIEELSAKMLVNRRQLERRFSAAIGLSPKQLTKIIRLQNALKMMIEKPSDSLTALAYESGYYDQAHFIKDFKEFTGISPKQFFAGNLQLSSLFISAE